MGYPRRLLSDDEHVRFEMKPHWRSLILPAIILIVEVFAVVWLVNIISVDWQWLRWVVIAAFVIILIGWVLRPFLEWLSSQYVFTDRRIITRSGIIAKHGRDMPLSKVNNVTFDISVFGRLLNYGELHVQSAGEDGGLDIRDVPNVEEIQREVYRLHEQDDERRRRRSVELGNETVLPDDGT